MPYQIMTQVISETVTIVTFSKFTHPRASRGGRGEGRWRCGTSESGAGTGADK